MASKEIIINGKTILPGTQMRVKANIARLPSGTVIDLPVYVYRSKKPGPVVLLSGGLHGDEVNGIEIVRRMVAQSVFDKLIKGTVIAVPVMNIYGFLNFSREVPDGKDINRSFPGNTNGSLASRVAHFLTHHVIDKIDIGVDFHTGGASRYNFPQVRYAANDPKAEALARAFAAPVILQSKLIDKSLRKQAFKMKKTILVYEGGESLRLEEDIVKEGTAGAKRLLTHLGMLDDAPAPISEPIFCKSSSWLRAKRSGIYSGIHKSGAIVNKKDVLGRITDPFGEFSVDIKSTGKAFIIGHNNMPIVNQGDALLHLGIIS
jgi:predicted deacylase